MCTHVGLYLTFVDKSDYMGNTGLKVWILQVTGLGSAEVYNGLSYLDTNMC